MLTTGRRKFAMFRAAGLALLLASCPCLFASDAQLSSDGGEAGRVLVIGAIKADPTSARANFSALAEYVQSKLADVGVKNVFVVAASNRVHMTDLLRHGRVDWLSETPYNAVYFEHTGLVESIARTWRSGAPTYRSLFFVRRDSKLDSISEAADHTIAFEHPGSTSAYFVPAVDVVSHGLTLSALPSPRARAKQGTVGYSFSYDEFNTAAWVHKGIVDIGVLSNTAWAVPEIVPEAFKNDFRILHETGSLPRGIELVRRNLDADLKVRLREVLLTMHTDPAAAQVLEDFYRTRKFDALTEEDEATLADLREKVASFEQLEQ